jgi:hypothetical protein
MNKIRRGADENTHLLLRKSRPKKSRDIKYIIKYTHSRAYQINIFVGKIKTDEKTRY